jgi:hypothetical protein
MFDQLASGGDFTMVGNLLLSVLGGETKYSSANLSIQNHIYTSSMPSKAATALSLGKRLIRNLLCLVHFRCVALRSKRV